MSSTQDETVEEMWHFCRPHSSCWILAGPTIADGHGTDRWTDSSTLNTPHCRMGHYKLCGKEHYYIFELLMLLL